MEDYSEELLFASELVVKCAKGYMSDHRAGCETKENAVGSYDIVTDSDIKAEDGIVDGIRARYPNDKFICEERHDDGFTDARTWIVDPIDGTMNFYRGIGMYGTQLVLTVGKRPVMSVIYLPASDELFTASEAAGARVNGMPINGPKNRPLKQCIVSISDFSRRSQEWRVLQSKMMGSMYDEVARMKMYGAACVDFCMLAQGKVDIHMRFANHMWDYLPGLYLCRKAGVYVDDELLDRTKFLLLGPSKETCDEFRTKVIRDLL